MSGMSCTASYLAGWRSLLRNWKVLSLTYGINLLLAFIAVGPLSNLLTKSIGRTTLGDKISSTFDYTLITDIIRHEGSAFEISLAVVGSFIMLYLPWAVFYQGGYMSIIRNDNTKVKLKEFWRGGAEYFFRYLRLTIYTLGSTLLVLYILSRLLINKVQPFNLDSEGPLMTQFWGSILVFLIIAFIIGIFKELAKNLIAASDKKMISTANLLAIKGTFRSRAIFLSLINLLVLLVAAALYFLLRKLIGSHLIPAIIVGQLFLIYRLAYKYIRLASYYYYLKPKPML